MRVLVTGALGGVGREVVRHLVGAGHDVTRTDRVPAPSGGDDATPYIQADLTQTGEAMLVVAGHEAVVHSAAIPEPTKNTADVVFRNNVLSTFNVVEAAKVTGVRRLVNLSSETVLGFHYAAAPVLPPSLPIDETWPVQPADPYGLSKVVGEEIISAAVRSSDLRAVSFRPSWVQYPDSYEIELGETARDPGIPSINLRSYTDARDLAEAIGLAVTCDLPGHEVMYLVNPDNVGDQDLEEQALRHFDQRVSVRPGYGSRSSAVDCSKARKLLGWTPQHSWRDHVVTG